jgi:hypothetical protein
MSHAMAFALAMVSVLCIMNCVYSMVHMSLVAFLDKKNAYTILNHETVWFDI